MENRGGSAAAKPMQDRWMRVDQVLALAKERLDAGNLDGAEHLLRQIVSFRPRHVDAHHYLSLVSYRQGRLREAIRHAEKAAKLAPKNAVFHSNLAQMYRLSGKLAEAREQGQKALKLKPDFPEALNNLGIVCFEMGHYAEAEESYRKAVAQRPDFPEALNNLGNTLRQMGCDDEAAEAYRSALEKRPDYAEALANWGVVERDRGNLEEAERLFARAIESNPKNPVARTARATLSLLRGDWTRGLPEFEWRKGLSTFKRPRHRGETWTGQPLAGKRLLVFSEQGIGETIAFARLLVGLGALGPSEIVCLVDERLVDLFARSLTGVTVVAQVSPLEAFDYSVALQSLPLRLGLGSPDALKPLPYLAADPATTERWQKRLEGVPRPWVAVAWRGESSRRMTEHGMPFADFARLFEASEGTFLLTQTPDGPLPAELPESRCQTLAKELGDFSETVGLLSVADLTVAVDGPLAHLSGALGRETRVLLYRVPDWRWGLEGETNSLYARVKLIRAGAEGWDEALSTASEAIKAL